MFILWNHMVTTKHKRRSLVPLSLPTSQPHPGTSYYWFSRLQGLRIIAMNHRRVISKYPKSPNFRAPNEKKHQMFLSKKLFFSKWGKGISFWPRDKTQWSSVLASSTLVVVKRTCENPGELSTHPTEGTVRGDVFFFPTETFPGVFVVGQGASNGKWRNFPASHLATLTKFDQGPLPTSRLSLLTANPNNARFFVFDLQITQNDHTWFARCLIWANIEEHLMIPPQMWIRMMRWKSDRFWSGVMIHGGGGTLAISFIWIAERKEPHMEACCNM